MFKLQMTNKINIIQVVKDEILLQQQYYQALPWIHWEPANGKIKHCLRKSIMYVDIITMYIYNTPFFLIQQITFFSFFTFSQDRTTHNIKKYDYLIRSRKINKILSSESTYKSQTKGALIILRQFLYFVLLLQINKTNFSPPKHLPAFGYVLNNCS